MQIDIVRLKWKQLFYHLIVLTLWRYCCFYHKILPWQPQMHGQTLYNLWTWILLLLVKQMGISGISQIHFPVSNVFKYNNLDLANCTFYCWLWKCWLVHLWHKSYVILVPFIDSFSIMFWYLLVLWNFWNVIDICQHPWKLYFYFKFLCSDSLLHKLYFRLIDIVI